MKFVRKRDFLKAAELVSTGAMNINTALMTVKIAGEEWKFWTAIAPRAIRHAPLHAQVLLLLLADLITEDAHAEKLRFCRAAQRAIMSATVTCTVNPDGSMNWNIFP